MISYLMVFVGGGTGSMARFLLNNIFGNRPGTFFLGTLLSNVISSFLLGFIMFLFINERVVNKELRMLLAVGFCGGFSTFSTFSFENLTLLQEGHTALAVMNMAGNLLICLISVAGGFYLAKILTP